MSFVFTSDRERKKPDDPRFQDGVNLIYALLTNDLLRKKLWKKITPTMHELLNILDKDIPALEKLTAIQKHVAGLGSKGSDVFAKLVEEKKGDTPYDLSNFNFEPEKDIPALLKKKGLFKRFTGERDTLYYLLMTIVQPLAENTKSIIENLGTDKEMYSVDDETGHAKYHVDPQQFIENAFQCVANLKYLITDKEEMRAINESLIADMRKYELRQSTVPKR